VDWARDILRTTLEIVRKPADQRGFSVIARRWVVERTLAWLTACRRLARDYERDPRVSEALIRWAGHRRHGPPHHPEWARTATGQNHLQLAKIITLNPFHPRAV
jgi:hypothetical protein